MTDHNETLAPVMYIPHGGGPLPLLGDPGHEELVAYLSRISERIATPGAILVVSAHWETATVSLGATESPPLIYDYYGFPEESYKIAYPAPGAPALRDQVVQLLSDAGIASQVEEERGLDHGVFVPLKIMFPNAEVPCLQLSLLEHLNPMEHISLGEALAPLRRQNVMILGSGMSFHNMGVFRSHLPEAGPRSEAFDDWLNEVCCDSGLSDQERKKRLMNWAETPDGRFCQRPQPARHPRLRSPALPLLALYQAWLQDR